MKRLLFLVMALSFVFPAFAVDIWEGETSNINCTPPTAYMDGEPIRADDVLTFNLYLEGEPVPVQEAQTECSFIVQPPVGSYVYRTTAVSSYYNTESFPSDDNAEVVVNVKKRPNQTMNTTATRIPAE